MSYGIASNHLKFSIAEGESKKCKKKSSAYLRRTERNPFCPSLRHPTLFPASLPNSVYRCLIFFQCCTVYATQQTIQAHNPRSRLTAMPRQIEEMKRKKKQEDTSHKYLAMLWDRTKGKQWNISTYFEIGHLNTITLSQITNSLPFCSINNPNGSQHVHAQFTRRVTKEKKILTSISTQAFIKFS